MGKQYTIPFYGNVAVSSGDVDLAEIAPAEGRRLRVVGLRFGKLGAVEDGTENIRRITMRRLAGPVTSGSGGSTGIPSGVNSALDDPEFTVEVLNSTVAAGTGGGTGDRILDNLSWNNRTQGEWSLNGVARYPDRMVLRLEESLDEYEGDFIGGGTIVVEEAAGGYD